MFLTSLLALSSFFIQTPTDQVPVHATIASTEQERQAGFQNVTELEEEQGMLFVFDKPGYYPFWMDQTHVPLALIFLDGNYEIVDIEYGIPYSRKNICGSKPYQYVLEVNPKLILKHQIDKGCKLIQENVVPSQSNEKKS